MPAGFVSALKHRTARNVPVVVFAGSIRSAADVPALLAAGVSVTINEHAAPRQLVPSLAPSPFPDSFDRRSSRAHASAIPMSYRAGQTDRRGAHAQRRQGGVGVRTMSPVAAGSVVQIKFRLPAGISDIEARDASRGATARSARIQFEQVDASAQSRSTPSWTPTPNGQWSVVSG